jgi:hypothetical protein
MAQLIDVPVEGLRDVCHNNGEPHVISYSTDMFTLCRANLLSTRSSSKTSLSAIGKSSALSPSTIPKRPCSPVAR